MTALLLLVITAGDIEAESPKAAVLREAAKIVDGVWKSHRRYWSKEPSLGPVPKTKPIGKLKNQFGRSFWSAD